MAYDDFEKLVVDALETIPEFFKEKLSNIDIVIEEWPMQRLSPGRLLLGLYQGVPATTWGRSHSLTLPDKITIFKGPIELVGRNDPSLIKQVVTDTVEHEIAHHFGISDERIKELKQQRN